MSGHAENPLMTNLISGAKKLQMKTFGQQLV